MSWTKILNRVKTYDRELYLPFSPTLFFILSFTFVFSFSFSFFYNQSTHIRNTQPRFILLPSSLPPLNPHSPFSSIFKFSPFDLSFVHFKNHILVARYFLSHLLLCHTYLDWNASFDFHLPVPHILATDSNSSAFNSNICFKSPSWIFQSFVLSWNLVPCSVVNLNMASLFVWNATMVFHRNESPLTSVRLIKSPKESIYIIASLDPSVRFICHN